LLDGEAKRIAEVMALEIARKVNEFVLEADRLEQEQESQASEALTPTSLQILF
jgi:hypothetical protein